MNNLKEKIDKTKIPEPLRSYVEKKGNQLIGGLSKKIGKVNNIDRHTFYKNIERMAGKEHAKKLYEKKFYDR